MEYPQLEREALTRALTGVKVREGQQQLYSIFAGTLQDIEGDQAKWDEVQPIRTLDTEFETRDSLATNTSTGTVIPRSSGMTVTYKKREVKPEMLRNLRAPGTEAKMSAEQKLALAIGDMKRRYVWERWEFLIASALRDNLSYTINGVTHAPDFNLDASHNISAGTSWATATTDIDGDIETFKRLIVEDSGFVPTRVLCGRNIFGYLRKNSTIKEWFTAREGAPASLNSMMGQTLRMYGMDWTTVDSGYISGGSWTPHIPDDTIIVMPEPSADWFQMQRGSVMVPNGNVYGSNVNGGHVEVYGEAMYAKFKDEPPSAWQYLRWAGLAVPVFTWAYLVCDVTP